MKAKKVFLVYIIISGLLSLNACTSKARESADQAAANYNAEVQSYNEKVDAYNNAVESIEFSNASLTDAISEAQNAIDEGGVPYDEETLNSLNEKIENIENKLVEVPDKMTTLEPIVVNEYLKNKGYEIFAEETDAKTEELKAIVIPEIPEVPDNSDEITALNEALEDYESSVSIMSKINAPSDEYVMEKLGTIDTITDMAAVTEDHDPNNKLGKQGGYIGCIYFFDSQVDQSKLSSNGDSNIIIGIGTDGGGAIEIFSCVEDAEARNTYLGAFDGTMLASGSHYVFGTVIIRTSDELTATQQNELTDKIKEALISD